MVNACGGCSTLPAQPGTACGQCGTRACLGADYVICTDPGRNACNGCTPLPTYGQACGQCGSNVCNGTNAVRCQDPGHNACNGCATLAGAPSSSCGVCGHYQCSGTEAVACDDPGIAFDTSVTYAVLATKHSGCADDSMSMSGDCLAAINRWCSGLGCGAVSGFAPVEFQTSLLQVTCTSGTQLDVSYSTELAAQAAWCDGSNERVGAYCNTAIHRLCIARGHVTGYGPVENYNDRASIICLDSASVRSTTYTVLGSYFWQCDGSGQRWGAQCNASIHRWCAAQGFESGFGPVNVSGTDSVQVVCVN